MKKSFVHTCSYSSFRVGDFRDKHILGGVAKYGGGLTVWEHVCKDCGTTLYSTSQWQYPPDAGGVNEETLKRCKVRTPERVEQVSPPEKEYAQSSAPPPIKRSEGSPRRHKKYNHNRGPSDGKTRS